MSTFSPQGLVALVGEDSALVIRLVQKCHEQIGPVWDDLLAAIRASRHDEASRLAHLLRGSVALVGAGDLVTILERWESASSAGEDIAPTDVRAATPLFRSLSAAMNDFLIRQAALVQDA